MCPLCFLLICPKISRMIYITGERNFGIDHLQVFFSHRIVRFRRTCINIRTQTIYHTNVVAVIVSTKSTCVSAYYRALCEETIISNLAADNLQEICIYRLMVYI